MRALLGLIVLIVTCQVVTAQAARTVLKIGDKAPDFALPNGDGKLVTLGEYLARGSVVVIFYRGYW